MPSEVGVTMSGQEMILNVVDRPRLTAQAHRAGRQEGSWLRERGRASVKKEINSSYILFYEWSGNATYSFASVPSFVNGAR